jgi:uncharacterized RDD family membrane protein YckC
VVAIAVRFASTELVSCQAGTAECEQLTDGAAMMLFVVIGLLFVAAVGYRVLLDGRWGRTVGRRALGIAVLDATEPRPIGVGRALVRELAKILSAVPLGLGFLWMVWDPGAQTWHDKLARSRVVLTASGADRS